ncbi:pectinesterase inhibitor [Phtheirospermum japonicum]|uniref:Pectinesterase inhibitor n=1 Tax=Phtheirospermum japonicum TaxID=374723 RepID=A0A830BXZ3_9LAMI|nr:pectinesterase inhibitor [Phtheirospermum japonicum]
MTAFRLLHFISLLLSTLIIVCAAAVSPKQICPKTRNPSLCFRILGSTDTPVDLRDLSRKALKFANLSVILALDEAQALGKFEENPVLKDRYRSCWKSFGRVNDYVAEYSKLLADQQRLQSVASDALKVAGACDPLFSQPPSEPADLKTVSDNLQDVCSILLVIALQHD